MAERQGIRRITDDDGQGWEVWEAHPRLADRRRVRDRRAVKRAGVGDRRTAGAESRPPLADAEGWLVFRGPHDERRRSAIPGDWWHMPAEDLLAVLRRARDTAPFPRPRT